MVDVSNLSDRELAKLEKEIFNKYLGGVAWPAVFWAFANLAVWLSLWPLVLMDIIPLWAGFIIAWINVSLAYLPSHEAQHDIIARPGEKWRWLNQAVGHLSVVPLAYSYHALRETHMEHHKHANDPVLDPDYSSKAKNGWGSVWGTLNANQPGKGPMRSAYQTCLQRLGTPLAQKAMLHQVIWQLFYYGFLCAMAWGGYALEAALLWWLPRHLGLVVLRFYLSWMPHHPGHETGRYKDTRAFKSRLGHYGSLGMQYHILHHLHPRVPLHRHKRLYQEVRPVLEARGCELGGL